MLIRIDPADERAIYVQIMDEVKRAFVNGIVEPHDALPSVRELARDLKVNPNTVKQAYRELEREGLVYTERGRGTFVGAWSPTRPERERDELARSVAERAVRDAVRNGISPDELVAAIRSMEESRPAADGEEVA